MTWKTVANQALIGAMAVGIFWSFSTCTARVYEAQNRCVSLKVHP